MIPKLSRNFIQPFVKKYSKKIEGKVLDAGAGKKPYKKFFKHTEYESTDWIGEHTFLSNIQSIPRNEKTYDGIICTQVLEHVREPDKVLKEFNRILKKDGKLILTLPQSYHIHEAPHNYFTYTIYGITYLLQKNGFKTEEMEMHGKWYTFLADEFRSANRRNYHLLPLLFPFSEILFPIIGMILDVFDNRNLQTLGYSIFATKIKDFESIDLIVDNKQIGFYVCGKCKRQNFEDREFCLFCKNDLFLERKDKYFPKF